ncbi:D-glycero-beta-D-manno-heptose 1-phosphate adenylyltransferase [Mucilaginibacter sp.]|jgi:rfaE bifunctional protein nucleotidyltransferase chain/domain|uniref:D-glycero-beta-D-manno-heptose 1-phosphate adenylyltransferase n=1 Tax=Mucilaginibacter sp. TaxID=1882438 RepID=UPI003561BE46
MRPGIEQTLLAKINELTTATERLQQWHKEGQTVVFTNGVFDVLHVGHITYLSKAAELGDKLVIGINADESVKGIKGDGRPFNDQHSRALLLASLFFVDAVVMFNDSTPLNLIRTLLPDILVKGADYTIENIVGAKEVIANGGAVKTIDFVDGFSSTAIINKMRG